MLVKWRVVGDMMWWFKGGILGKKEGEWFKSCKEE